MIYRIPDDLTNFEIQIFRSCIHNNRSFIVVERLAAAMVLESYDDSGSPHYTDVALTPRQYFPSQSPSLSLFLLPRLRTLLPLLHSVSLSPSLSLLHRPTTETNDEQWSVECSEHTIFPFSHFRLSRFSAPALCLSGGSLGKLSGYR